MPSLKAFAAALISFVLQQRYLPEFKKCPVQFIHSILADASRVFHNNQVTRIRVPEWPEIGIRQIMPVALTVPHFRQYLPESWPERPDKVDRQFFWDVLATLDQQFVLSLIEDIGSQRKERQQQVIQRAEPELNISPEWAAALS